ncbi:hypothetical protein HMPREF0454_02036 [Hafnia alvei ATCC 51873]|uniref:Uncharacterized protein n=1 Tax=Hafnia alvei ATCC 51873 TaxID=1002364 RepID=G9Y642_HAFAL|nr:hypothetical protein HMPREF0454_02036 [Hafnia alvei ATCC 51873]
MCDLMLHAIALFAKGKFAKNTRVKLVQKHCCSILTSSVDFML